MIKKVPGNEVKLGVYAYDAMWELNYQLNCVYIHYATMTLGENTYMGNIVGFCACT